MQPLNGWHIAFLILAVVLEIVANIFLKYSDGFRKRLYGFLSLAMVMGAFSALAQAVKGIDLSVAYALWGGFGVVATLAAGWILFNQRLRPRSWVGLSLLLVGMVMIKLA
ncbi:multidrug/spermidine efflux SMR transporter subunit MdtI [Mixta sp. Marseille-Q2659]|uniref:multidrug/spermidine efflux SMR transporter subunit MdtI n=1 Tax=Mixta sp. Marseille-Q2659 TaxID=2736607 RepID=UPI0023B993C6|nr:multidrug/spermidine efflux SMR transporter subunit MdtI [Mixta sp. Marseille-Q2659]